MGVIILKSEKTNLFVISLIFSLLSFFLSIGVQDIFDITNNIFISFSIPYILAIVSIVLLLIGFVKLTNSEVKSSTNLKVIQILTTVIVVISIVINSFLLIAGTSGI